MVKPLNKIDMNALKKRIKKHEGFWDTVYLDSLGKRTVGYGHLCVENTWKDNKKYSESFLNIVFDKDFDNACNLATKLIGDLTLNYDAKLVIVEMCFQLGYKVSKFKKMWEALKVGDYSNASKEMLDSNWHKQTSKRCEDLAKIMKES